MKEVSAASTPWANTSQNDKLGATVFSLFLPNLISLFVWISQGEFLNACGSARNKMSAKSRTC